MFIVNHNELLKNIIKNIDKCVSSKSSQTTIDFICPNIRSLFINHSNDNSLFCCIMEELYKVNKNKNITINIHTIDELSFGLNQQDNIALRRLYPSKQRKYFSYTAMQQCVKKEDFNKITLYNYASENNLVAYLITTLKKASKHKNKIYSKIEDMLNDLDYSQLNDDFFADFINKVYSAIDNIDESELFKSHIENNLKENFKNFFDELLDYLKQLKKEKKYEYIKLTIQVVISVAISILGAPTIGAALIYSSIELFFYSSRYKTIQQREYYKHLTPVLNYLATYNAIVIEFINTKLLCQAIIFNNKHIIDFSSFDLTLVCNQNKYYQNKISLNLGYELEDFNLEINIRDMIIKNFKPLFLKTTDTCNIFIKDNLLDYLRMRMDDVNHLTYIENPNFNSAQFAHMINNKNRNLNSDNQNNTKMSKNYIIITNSPSKHKAKITETITQSILHNTIQDEYRKKYKYTNRKGNERYDGFRDYSKYKIIINNKEGYSRVLQLSPFIKIEKKDLPSDIKCSYVNKFFKSNSDKDHIIQHENNIIDMTLRAFADNMQIFNTKDNFNASDSNIFIKSYMIAFMLLYINEVFPSIDIKLLYDKVIPPYEDEFAYYTFYVYIRYNNKNYILLEHNLYEHKLDNMISFIKTINNITERYKNNSLDDNQNDETIVDYTTQYHDEINTFISKICEIINDSETINDETIKSIKTYLRDYEIEDAGKNNIRRLAKLYIKQEIISSFHEIDKETIKEYLKRMQNELKSYDNITLNIDKYFNNNKDNDAYEKYKEYKEILEKEHQNKIAEDMIKGAVSILFPFINHFETDTHKIMYNLSKTFADIYFKGVKQTLQSNLCSLIDFAYKLNTYNYIDIKLEKTKHISSKAKLKPHFIALINLKIKATKINNNLAQFAYILNIGDKDKLLSLLNIKHSIKSDKIFENIAQNLDKEILEHIYISSDTMDLTPNKKNKLNQKQLNIIVNQYAKHNKLYNIKTISGDIFSLIISSMTEPILNAVLNTNYDAIVKSYEYVLNELYVYKYDEPLATKHDNFITFPLIVNSKFISFDLSVMIYGINLQTGGLSKHFSFNHAISDSNALYMPLQRILSFLIIDEKRMLNTINPKFMRFINDLEFYANAFGLYIHHASIYKVDEESELAKEHRAIESQYNEFKDNSPIYAYNEALQIIEDYAQGYFTSLDSCNAHRIPDENKARRLIECLDIIGQNNLKAMYVGNEEIEKSNDVKLRVNNKNISKDNKNSHHSFKPPRFIGRLATTIIMEDGLWIG